MIVCRFMSAEEFIRYDMGETIRSNTDWFAIGNNSTSKGVCFFPADKIPPEARMEYLTGVVTMQICAVFATSKKMHRSIGLYRDPVRDTLSWPVATMEVKELNTPSYSKRDFQLLRLGICCLNHTIKWCEEEAAHEQ